MLEKNYKNIIYFISIAIVATIVAQVYWNIKNYEVNKQQINNQIHTSFDISVEKYYTKIAKDDAFNLFRTGINTYENGKNNLKNKGENLRMFISSKADSSKGKFPKKISYLSITDSIFVDVDNDSIVNHGELIHESQPIKFRELTNKIIVSFQKDIINLKEIDSIFSSELNRKNLSFKYGFNFEHSGHFQNTSEVKTYNLENFPDQHLSTTSNSSFLPHGTNLELRYIGTTSQILKRMIGSIILSFLLSLIIIGCLLFLFKTISKQKQISEMKNDLISNITHEFKTPIATIGVALESIKDFNAINDPKKTNRYIEMSNNQLLKLNTMVEKLLETASLDSKDLELQKEEVYINDLLSSIIEKHKIQSNKLIIFNSDESELSTKIDLFHFENAINNIIDNAVKYGGNEITIDLKKEKNNTLILVSDNGNILTNEQKNKVFDKFYRVPKGNTHDVKGFGIGLYYSRKIIEKHHGSIHLDLNNNLTTFKISLPNG